MSNPPDRIKIDVKFKETNTDDETHSVVYLEAHHGIFCMRTESPWGLKSYVSLKEIKEIIIYGENNE